jgi:hypothetical protein
MMPPPLPEIQAAFPGWRGWRTAEGGLAARKGGSTPTGVQARGRTLAELKLAISFAILAASRGDSIERPVLGPREQPVLDALEAATEPLPARTISDVSGVPISTTQNVLAILRAKNLITRRPKGRTWLYAVMRGGEPNTDEQQAGAAAVPPGAAPQSPARPQPARPASCSGPAAPAARPDSPGTPAAAPASRTSHQTGPHTPPAGPAPQGTADVASSPTPGQSRAATPGIPPT